MYKILWVITLVYIYSSFCGFYNLIEKFLGINKARNIKIPIDFNENYNGNDFTIYFNFKFKGQINKEYQLLRIEILKNKNEGDIPKVYSNFLKVDYFYNTKEEYISISYVEDIDTLKRIKIKDPKLFEWNNSMIAISLSYIMNKGLIYYTNFKNINLKMDLKLEFSDLKIRKKSILYLGGHTSNEKDIKKGFKGEIGNINISNNYFKNLDDIWLIKYPKYLNSFNSHYYQLDFINSKNKKEIKIDGFYKDKKYILKGKIENNKLPGYILNNQNEIQINKINLFKNNNDLIKIFNFNFEIKFEKNIKESYILLENENEASSNYFSVILLKKGNNRIIRLNLKNGKNKIFYISKLELIPDIINIFQTSFVFIPNNGFYFMIDNQKDIFEKSQLFKNINFKVKNKYNLKISPIEKVNKGKISLYKFFIGSNLGNIVYNKNYNLIKSEKNNKDSLFFIKNCKKDCSILTDLNVYNFNCLKCNNLVIYKDKCVVSCPYNYKNINGTCKPCYYEDCLDSDISKFILEKSNKNDTSYFFYPERKILNPYFNLKEIIEIKLLGLILKKDYELLKYYDSLSQKLHLDFTFKKNFQKKQIIAHVPESTKYYDTNRNLFYKDNYKKNINYNLFNSNKNKIKNQNNKKNKNQTFKDLGKNISRGFIGAQIAGLLTSSSTSSIANNKKLLKTILQNFIILQYVSFLLFFNVNIPGNLNEFIKSIFDDSVEIMNVFENTIMNIYSGNKIFDKDIETPPPPRFKDENISVFFLINNGIGIILQFIIFFLWIVVIILSYFFKESTWFGRYIRKLRHSFEYEYIISFVLAFEIETIIFITLNLINPVLTHGIFWISYTISLINMFILLWLYNLIFWVTSQPYALLENEYFKSKYGLIYESYKLEPFKKNFEIYNLTKNCIFGLFIVILYYFPFLQVTSCLVIYIFYIAIYMKYQPHIDIFDKIANNLNEVCFLIILFLYLILSLNDKFKIFTENGFDYFGIVILSIIIFSLISSIILLFIQLVLLIKDIIWNICCKKKENNLLNENEEGEMINKKDNDKKILKFNKNWKNRNNPLSYNENKQSYFG